MRPAPGAGRQPSGPGFTSGAYSGLVLNLICVLGSDLRFHHTRLMPGLTSHEGPPSPSSPPPPGPPGPADLRARSSDAARHSISRTVFPLASLMVSLTRSFSPGFDFKEKLIGAPYCGLCPAVGSYETAAGCATGRKRYASRGANKCAFDANISGVTCSSAVMSSKIQKPRPYVASARS